jgi:ATP synthase protein I
MATLYSWEAAYSALLGGMIYLIPHAYIANKLLAKTETAITAKHTLAELYIGQIWKMVIGALMFALVFVLVKPLSPFSLFGNYIAMQALGWYLQMKADKRFIKL